MSYGESRDHQDTTGGGSHDAHAGGGSREGRSGSTGGTRGGYDPGNPFGKGMGNSALADKQVMDKYLGDPDQHIANERDYWNAVGNLGKRNRDYLNKDNTPLENFGNKILGLGSIGELDPTQQALGASVNNPNASWGVDPLGVAATIGGMATGLPLGSVYSVGKGLAGWEGPMVAFDGYNDQSPFSNRVVSPVVDNGGSMPGSGASSSNGKGDQSGTIGGLGRVPVLLNDSPSVPGTPVTPPVTDPTTPPVVDPNAPGTLALYPDDPLKYGETIGGWNFWPHGQVPVNAADGGALSGPGSGQDDKIPAMLSNDEYVWSAQDVSDLGDGSSSEGHRRLDQMRQMVRQRAGRKNTKTIAPPMHSIGSLMQRAAA